MSEEIGNLPASVHGRLRNKARQRARPFQEIFQYYANERFLYRLAQSQYAQMFVLKGPLIFFAWGIPLERATRDIDLRGFTHNTIENLREIIKDICLQPVEPDGMAFDQNTVTGELTREGADYEGIRLRFWGYLGDARARMIIDIGFTDQIVPSKTKLQFPTILNMPEPILYGYPPEMVIAEKLEAMVSLGMMNSRMKDFHDILKISNRFDFEGRVLQKAIVKTFQTRNTHLPQDTPVALSDSFIDEKAIQWDAFMNRMDPPGSVSFDVVIDQLRLFLIPLLRAISVGEPLQMNWQAGTEWV